MLLGKVRSFHFTTLARFSSLTNPAPTQQVLGKRLGYFTKDVRRYNSTHEMEYEELLRRANYLGELYRSYPMKQDERDTYNDLFTQLHMGLTTKSKYRSFILHSYTFYPVPRRTQHDQIGYSQVKYALANHFNFIYRLRISFFCRMLVAMMDIWYGRHIMYFEKLEDDAFWSVVQNEKNWSTLHFTITSSLTGNAFTSKEMEPVYRLCRNTALTIYHNHALANEVLSDSIYTYLLNYVPPDKKTFDSFEKDEAKLHPEGTAHSVYLIDIAWTQELHDGLLRISNTYKKDYVVKPRAFIGYAQLLCNFLFFNVTHNQRMEMVNWLKVTHDTFLNSEKDGYSYEDYKEFFKTLNSGIISNFPEMNEGFIGIRFDPAIHDINKVFFGHSDNQYNPRRFGPH